MLLDWKWENKRFWNEL